MKKIKFIIHVLKETWKALNKEKNCAKQYIKHVKEFYNYVKTVYDNMNKMSNTIDQMSYILVPGQFMNKLFEIVIKFKYTSYTAFDEKGQMNILNSTYDDTEKLENNPDFSQYEMRFGLIDIIGKYVDNSDDFLVMSKEYMKTHDYNIIFEEYEELKKSIEHEDSFHGLTFLDIFKKIENGEKFS